MYARDCKVNGFYVLDVVTLRPEGRVLAGPFETAEAAEADRLGYNIEGDCEVWVRVQSHWRSQDEAPNVWLTRFPVGAWLALARKRGSKMTETERERLIDRRVWRRLASDPAYRNAASAEAASRREEEITAEEDRKVPPATPAEGRWI